MAVCVWKVLYELMILTSTCLPQVPGLEPRVIPIRYGAVGCPVVFQTTASSLQALVRYEEGKNRKLLPKHDCTKACMIVPGREC